MNHTRHLRSVHLLIVGSLVAAAAPTQSNTWIPVGGSHNWAVASPTYAHDGLIWASFITSPMTTAHLDRSTDRGDTFAPQSQIPNQLVIRELAVSPTFAQDQTLFQGQFTTGQPQDQLLKSTDGGASWSQLSVPGIGRIDTIRPAPNFASSQLMFVGRFDGNTLRSADGGQTWSNVQYVVDILNAKDVEFAADFATSNVVFVFNPYYNSVQRSTDGGQTFSWPPNSAGFIIEWDIEAAPIGPGSKRWVFAGGRGYLPTVQGPNFFRSQDNGLNFAVAGTGIPLADEVFRIETPPDFASSGRVYVGSSSGVYFSDDFGATFAPLPATGLPAGPVTNLFLAGGSTGDLFALRVTPGSWPGAPGQLYRLRLAGTGVVDVGNALAGSNGLPQLWADVDFGATTGFTLQLAGALAQAPALHVLGLAQANLPFAGGTVVPDPLLFVPFTTDAFGSHAVDLSWLPNDPAGTTAWVQTWLIDPAGPVRLAASNALRIQRL